jgi:hypothetical protein
MNREVAENGYESPRSEDFEDRPPSSSKNDNAAFKRNGKGKPGLSNGHANRGEDLHNGEEKDGDNSNKSDSDNSDDGQHTQNGEDGQTDEEGSAPVRVSIRDRICCTTWSWFTLTMATGGIANVLHSSMLRLRQSQGDEKSNRSRSTISLKVVRDTWGDSYAIEHCLLHNYMYTHNPTFQMASGKLFQIDPQSIRSLICAHLCMFNLSVLWALLTRYVRRLYRMYVGHHSLAKLIEGSIGTILSNIAQYGVPKTGLWLQTTMQVCFWAYATLSVLSSAAIYLMLWSTV